MIEIKSAEEVRKIRIASALVAEVLQLIKQNIRPGVSAWELDKLAEEYILKKGGRPAFKGYKGYPATLCVSVNEEVVHGIPTKNKILKEGDIVSIDVGVFKNGFYGDAAITLPVGNVSQEKLKLVETTYRALYNGIARAVPGAHLQDVSHAIEATARQAGYDVVREYVGHGIGRNLHEEPSVPNYGEPGVGPRLEVGMVFTLEPMLTMGKGDVEVLEDGWTVVTKDRLPAAHFEHVIVLTNDGPKILSLLPDGREVKWNG